jgi:hypothetical protein
MRSSHFFARRCVHRDFAILGWAWRTATNKVGSSQFPNVRRWYRIVMARPAFRCPAIRGATLRVTLARRNPRRFHPPSRLLGRALFPIPCAFAALDLESIGDEHVALPARLADRGAPQRCRTATAA